MTFKIALGKSKKHIYTEIIYGNFDCCYIMESILGDSNTLSPQEMCAQTATILRDLAKKYDKLAEKRTPEIYSKRLQIQINKGEGKND